MSFFCCCCCTLLLVLFAPWDLFAIAQQHPSSKLLRSRQIRTQNQTLATIFADYDSNTRPPVRELADHAAIIVTVSLVLNRVIWHKHSVEVDVNLKQEWEDSRLAFTVDPREDIHEVMLPKHLSVWRPDTFFVGAQEQSPSIGTRAVERYRTVIEQLGYVRSDERRTLRVNFQSDGTFPVRDRRSIKFALSSVSYSMEDVAYLWANSPPLIQPVQVAEHLYEEGGALYAFEEAEAGECHAVGNSSSTGSFSCIELIVRFRGNTSHGWLGLLLPSILLVLTSWLHFWIHSSWSVPRTLSSAVPFLVFICLLLLLPIESCALRIWLLLCTLFTFLSLVEYFLVIRCYPTVKTARLAALQRHHQIRPPSEQNNYEDGKGGTTTTMVVTQDEPLITAESDAYAFRRSRNNLDLVSRLAFPIGFLLATVVYVLFYIF